MPKAYQYDETTKKYTGEIERQRDPLESQQAGYDVWLMPANSTDIPPLEPKEEFDVVWNGSAWEYQEIPQLEPEPEPTELELAYQELYRAKSALAATDYRALKYIDGEYTEEQYAVYRAERAELRQAVRDAEERVKEQEPRETPQPKE